jgi:hypothetical protein
VAARGGGAWAGLFSWKPCLCHNEARSSSLRQLRRITQYQLSLATFSADGFALRASSAAHALTSLPRATSTLQGYQIRSVKKTRRTCILFYSMRKKIPVPVFPPLSFVVGRRQAAECR